MEDKNYVYSIRWTILQAQFFFLELKQYLLLTYFENLSNYQKKDRKKKSLFSFGSLLQIRHPKLYDNKITINLLFENLNDV